MIPLCIYHGNCADGFGAAAVVHQYFDGNVELMPARYQEDPPNVCGRDVIIVDFSYKRDVLMEMSRSASSIIILDHHKSARDDLHGLPELTHNYVDTLKDIKSSNDVRVRVHFDMNHSGAMLTWHFFYPTQLPPRIIEHIEDRDLWKFGLVGTREIQAALFSYPYDIDLWTKFMDDDELVNALYKEGVILLRKHFKDVNELIKSGQHRIKVDGHDVPALNVPYIFASDAGNIMAQGEKFAVCYTVHGDKVSFSLRSTDQGLDVSKIAAKFGGGGHRNAAGFVQEDVDFIKV